MKRSEFERLTDKEKDIVDEKRRERMVSRKGQRNRKVHDGFIRSNKQRIEDDAA